jgi:hypothetical protein
VADEAASAANVTDDAAGAANVADDVAGAADDSASAGGSSGAGGTPGGGGPGGPAGGPPAGSQSLVGGQQYTIDCAEASRLYAGANGLPTDPALVAPGSPGIFSPLPQHWAVRNVDGSITDTTILMNIRTYTGGGVNTPLNPALEAFEHVDTFSPQTYEWLIQQLQNVRPY